LTKGFTLKVNGIEKDISTVNRYYSNEFTGMTVDGKTYTDKKEAGTAFLESCRKLKIGEKEKPIGRYKGFEMSVSFDSFNSCYYIALKNNLSHKVEIGNDILGNITRIDNALNKFPEKLNNYKNKLEEINNNLKLAKLEVDKSFSRLSELREKEARLEELNKELSMENKEVSKNKKEKSKDLSKEKKNDDISL